MHENVFIFQAEKKSIEDIAYILLLQTDYTILLSNETIDLSISCPVISKCKKVHRSIGPPCALHVPDRVQICRSEHLAVNNSHVVCTFSDSEQSDLKTTLSIVNSYRKRGSAFLSVKFIFNELLCSPLGRQNMTCVYFSNV